jgi:hypothetical protein
VEGTPIESFEDLNKNDLHPSKEEGGGEGHLLDHHIWEYYTSIRIANSFLGTPIVQKIYHDKKREFCRRSGDVMLIEGLDSLESNLQIISRVYRSQNEWKCARADLRY